MGGTVNGVNLGTTGRYIQPSSPIQDPYANVPAPAVPATIGTFKPVRYTDNPNYGCQAAVSPCTLYSPGLWVGGIDFTKQTVLFQPGVYYIQGGGVTFKQTNGGNVNDGSMCSGAGCISDPATGTGMLFYDTGPAGSTLGHNPAGGIKMHNQDNIVFQGATLTTKNALGQTVPGPPYYGLWYFEDRTADANSHSLGQGNGCFSITGTIYITNTQAIMQADHSHYQDVTLGGTPCGNTTNVGDIIVGQLHLHGNAAYVMTLVPYGFLNIRQVALVSGGPHA